MYDDKKIYSHFIFPRDERQIDDAPDLEGCPFSIIRKCDSHRCSKDLQCQSKNIEAIL